MHRMLESKQMTHRKIPTIVSSELLRMGAPLTSQLNTNAQKYMQFKQMRHIFSTLFMSAFENGEKLKTNAVYATDKTVMTRDCHAGEFACNTGIKTLMAL